MTKSPIVGVLLAGGQAQRMGGGDKCLLPLGGETLLQRSMNRAQHQVDDLLLNANGNALRFARSGLPIIADVYADFPGPLAGIHAAMRWMRDHRPECEWLASFACDTPFFPPNLVQALKPTSASVAVAASGNRMHPTFGLWHQSLLEPLDQCLQVPPYPAMRDWVSQQSHQLVHFDSPGYDPFFNINRPQDLYDAEAILPLVKAASIVSS